MKNLKALTLGILASLGALFLGGFLEVIFPGFRNIRGDSWALIFIFLLALLEETVKFLVIAKGLSAQTTRSLVIKSLVFGFGFSFLEIYFLLEFWNQGADFIFSVLLMVLLHSLTAGYIGLFYFTGPKTPAKNLLIILGVALIHFIFNWMVFKELMLFYPLLFLLILFSYWLLKTFRIKEESI